MNDENSINNSQSYFYPSEQEPGYGIPGYNAYPTPMQHTAARVQIAEMHPSYHLSGLNQYPAGVYSTSPPHGSLPLNSPPPPSPELYDALSPPVSGSDTSGDGLYHHSNSSGANSPSSSRGHSLVHRSHRYNPTPSPTSSSSRRRSRSHDSEDDDDDVMGIAADQNLAYSRKEATRRQRIEAEQRRRDELREGYAKLKDALPVSNQKSSKVSLLERATNYIILLEQEKKELIDKLVAVEEEAKRLRVLNEKISLSTEGTPSPDHAMGRMTSPTPDTTHTPSHSLASVRGQQPPSEHSSPSASEGGH